MMAKSFLNKLVDADVSRKVILCVVICYHDKQETKILANFADAAVL